jgi:hypothetical protein
MGRFMAEDLKPELIDRLRQFLVCRQPVRIASVLKRIICLD